MATASELCGKQRENHQSKEEAQGRGSRERVVKQNSMRRNGKKRKSLAKKADGHVDDKVLVPGSEQPKIGERGKAEEESTAPRDLRGGRRGKTCRAKVLAESGTRLGAAGRLRTPAGEPDYQTENVRSGG